MGDTLQFSLQATDPDRDPLSTSFSVDGVAAKGGAPFTYIIRNAGEVTVRGTVSDGDLESYVEWDVDGDERSNAPPVIGAFLPQDVTPTMRVGETMLFAIDAHDPDGDSLAFAYTVDDSLVAEESVFEYLAPAAARKRVRVTVSDDKDSASGEWNLEITLFDNDPPVIDSFQPPAVFPALQIGDTMRFAIEASDPDHDPLAYAFTVDGIPVAQDRSLSYLASSVGSKHVRATASDGWHVTGHDWFLLVQAPANRPPVIDALQPAAADPTLTIGETMLFAIEVSDPDGDPIAYAITIDDSLAANTSAFSYRPASTGWKAVRATASDGEFAVSHDWNLRVTAVPDTIPPARVVITGYGAGAQGGEAYLEWIAVGRDGMAGLPAGYQVRRAPDPILSEPDWDGALECSGVPAPAPPGTPMAMVVSGLPPTLTVYLSIRASDEFGNISPLSDSPPVAVPAIRISGTVADADAGTMLAGIPVTLGNLQTESAADGAWEFSGLGPVSATITAGDIATAGTGAYYDVAFPFAATQPTVVLLRLIPARTLATTQYADFLQFFRSMTDIAGHPYGTQQRRWELPIDLYVSPYEKDGLDYRASIAQVAASFDGILGTHVFNVTASATGHGVEVAFVEGLNRDIYEVMEWTNDWYPSRGRIQFRTVYTPASAAILERTARHELGHALGLNHSSDIEHLMVGGVAPQVDAFSEDERAVIRCLYGIPRGFDNRWHLRR